jgi:hypothetical protein
MVPLASSSRLLSVLPCGIVQWIEKFQVISPNSLQLSLKIYESLESDHKEIILEKNIIL